MTIKGNIIRLKKIRPTDPICGHVFGNNIFRHNLHISSRS